MATENSRAGADYEENASDARAHAAGPAGEPLTAADRIPVDIIGRKGDAWQAVEQASRTGFSLSNREFGK